MASMNTRLNIKKLDGNIVQKHGGSKQVGFKQLGPGVETGVHGVHDKKHVWFKVELYGAQGDCKAEVFQVSNDDTAVAQRRLKEKKPKERTNTDCLVKEQEKEYQTGWKIKMGNVLDSCNQRSIQQCMKSGVTKHLGVAWIQQQNGLVNEINVTLFATVHCFLIQSGIVGNKLWRLDDVTSKVVLYRNMGFNESGEYKITFIGSGIDKEQHSAWELFSYREDSNEAAFVVATVDKIYAHELLTFNNIVSCEVIFKWEAGLKDDMDARSDVYVLSNGCKICSDDSDGYYWEYTPVGSQEYQVVCTRPDIATANVDMLDGFDRGLQTNVQVFMDFNYIMGRSITVMSRSITGYGLLILGCVGSLKANLQHMEALSITKVRYMMFTKARKKEIWLKGLFIESRYKLRLVAGIATGALVKGCSRSKVLAHVKVAVYRY
ncbi:hypothetical protein Tco_1078546 [Tanacetum coccineum]|uniref:Uncharacterized protein n=1 Tax=Tanacetum coccineum TaxID=301880 RepID=A0ABQ5HPB8_9ASTR